MRKTGQTVLLKGNFIHFHIIELILRRGMGLVRDAEFGGNSVIWSSSFST